MRSYRATKNLIAVSASTKETAINTEQTLSLSLLCSINDVINLKPRRESNAEELSGYEEADTVYDLGSTSEATLNFEKAQPQHFAFALAYALGSVSTAAAGVGYKHTITPIADDVDGSRSNPSFTAGQRYGNTVLKRRFASMFVDAFTATFAKDSWLKLVATLKGTGKVSDNIGHESITAAKNATSLTLAANGVQGADAAGRLDNVQRIIVELTSGVWTEVAYSAVSAATPAVIAITAPGATADMVTYKVLYIPTESASWMTFPARVSETPMRVAQMSVNLGGKWTGSAFSGGRIINSEVRSVEWNFNNNMDIEFVPGAGDAYAARSFRNGRNQVLRLNREFREYILQQHIDDNDTFGFYMLAEGAVYGDPHKYTVEVIFPKVAVIESPINVDGKRLVEAGNLIVLEDGTYGSVIVNVKNLQAAYAA